MAIHSGVVSTSRDGAAGSAMIETVRLLDSHEVKDALRASSAVLAVILSDSAHAQLNDAPAQYRSCMTTLKSDQIKVWVGVFGDRPTARRERPLTDDLSLPTAAAKLTDRARADLARREAEASLADMKERAAAAVPASDSRGTAAAGHRRHRRAAIWAARGCGTASPRIRDRRCPRYRAGLRRTARAGTESGPSRHLRAAVVH